MTDTASDTVSEESVREVLRELREINRELCSIGRELQVIEDNYDSLRDSSVQAVLSSVCEDMDYLVQAQREWHWEMDTLVSEVAPQDREVGEVADDD